MVNSNRYIRGSGGTIKFLKKKIFLLFFYLFALKMQHLLPWGGLYAIRGTNKEKDHLKKSKF